MPKHSSEVTVNDISTRINTCRLNMPKHVSEVSVDDLPSMQREKELARLMDDAIDEVCNVDWFFFTNV